MNRPAAFTLLEVLFAVVLLALIVAVCVPYMRLTTRNVSTPDITAFATQIDEHISRFKLSHTNDPSIEELSEILSSIGCTSTILNTPDATLHGQWVSITDGDHAVLRWAHAESEPQEVLP